MASFRQSRACVLTFILFAYTCTVCVGQGVWETQTETKTQGEDLSITCTVNGVTALDVARLTYEKSNGAKEAITDDDRLKPMFANTGRYSVGFSYGMESQTAILTLKVKGIRGEDAGRIGCFVLGKTKRVAYCNIHVLVPIESVFIQIQTSESEFKVDEGSTIKLRQGQESNVVCRATRNGSIIPPKLSVIIGGKNETNSNNFILVIKSERNEKTGTLGNFMSSSSLSYVTMQPDPGYNQKNMTCMAEVEGFPAKIASIILDVLFKPIITCPKYEFYGQMGKSIKLNCEVKSNPGSTLTWAFGDNKFNIETDSESADGIFVSGQEAQSEDLAKVSLTITTLNKTHFTNFYLKAKNDMGDSEVTMVIKQGADDSPTKPLIPSYSTLDEQEQQSPKDPQSSISGADKLAVQTTFIGVSLVATLTFLTYL